MQGTQLLINWVFLYLHARAGVFALGCEYYIASLLSLWHCQHSIYSSDPTYLFDRVLASIFDFLMNVHTPQLEFLEGTGWKGYDGHDMADDGVFEMGKLDLN